MKKKVLKASGGLKGVFSMGKLISALLLIMCIQLHSSGALSADSLGAKVNLPSI